MYRYSPPEMLMVCKKAALQELVSIFDFELLNYLKNLEYYCTDVYMFMCCFPIVVMHSTISTSIIKKTGYIYSREVFGMGSD